MPLEYLHEVKTANVYKRRRLGGLFVLATIVFAFYAGAGAGAEAPAQPYTVTAGDTLWSIATEHYPPSEDPRTRVEDIREESGLDGYGIRPGQHLELPQ